MRQKDIPYMALLLPPIASHTLGDSDDHFFVGNDNNILSIRPVCTRCIGVCTHPHLVAIIVAVR